MIKLVSIPTAIIVFILGAIPAHAQNTAAPCSAFQKQPDGKWKALRPINIQTDQGSAIIGPGMMICPATMVAGAGLCGSPAKLPLGQPARDWAFGSM
jgi:hypothetical protein